MQISRRRFLDAAAVAGVSAALGGPVRVLTGLDVPLSAQGAPRLPLSRRFPDLSRHFIFEYYVWYGVNPIEHWDESDRRPPLDIASNYMPRLGAYDSKSVKVMDQHARWVKDAGPGAINVSWWGRDSHVDRLIPALMDVMKAHDIRVTFHLEPYRDHHASYYAEDIEYLIRQYGDKRRWDTFLLLADERGRRGPVFKSFRTIVPPTTIDCHGQVQDVKDYADDAVWRTQTDRVRATFANDFDHVTLLADSLDWGRTRRCGFDGIAVYDNYVRPAMWRECAEACTDHDLVFSFNVNPGFDAIVRRTVEPGSCYVPPGIEPPFASAYEWTRSADLAAAAKASERRIGESFETTVALQSDPALSNARRGFFLAYINSFNEWHEGHPFEPMKDRGDLARDERANGYRNPDDGRYRLKALKRLLSRVL